MKVVLKETIGYKLDQMIREMKVEYSEIDHIELTQSEYDKAKEEFNYHLPCLSEGAFFRGIPVTIIDRSKQ